MRKLLNLHFKILQYLRQELKKKHTPKELVYFFKSFIVNYFVFVKTEYKIRLQQLVLLFDKEYNKKKIEYDKYQQYKKDLANAYRLVQYMLKQKTNRVGRKQVARDFIKYGRISKEMEATILKDLYGQRIEQK